ncbi:MAG: hypothetical protein RML72_01890 [Bacteroidia bacterium]|nr:dienelactone hydrolase family protein [Bacteroidia bacterium]MDW8157612.1 hypothetical protein [Bacteroidia bacterium]
MLKRVLPVFWLISCLLFFFSKGVLSSAFAQNELVFLEKAPKVNFTTAPLILLLHGMGADEKDLWFIAQQLPQNYRILSLRAPYRHESGGYRWFEIQFSSQGKVMNYGQAQQSCQSILRFLNSYLKQNGLLPQSIYVIGFSQGAMMGFLLLHSSSQIVGHAAIGGMIFPELVQELKSSTLANKNVWIAHGTRDEIIPVQAARYARQILQNLGVNLSYHEFPVGHHITPDILHALLAWLQKKVR